MRRNGDLKCLGKYKLYVKIYNRPTDIFFFAFTIYFSKYSKQAKLCCYI